MIGAEPLYLHDTPKSRNLETHTKRISNMSAAPAYAIEITKLGVLASSLRLLRGEAKLKLLIFWVSYFSRHYAGRETLRICSLTSAVFQSGLLIEAVALRLAS